MIRAIETIIGLRELWEETRGDPRIVIAILDGPVDRSHGSLAAADLRILETLSSGEPVEGAPTHHGTCIASVIFGQHAGDVTGIAPACRGLVVPIFTGARDGSLNPCSQVDLARAIMQAAQNGAQVINVSGGQFAPSGAAHPILADAVRFCAGHGVLIIAAVGNEGCDCLNVPAALPSVLAVGAMDRQGSPLDFSNWGHTYRTAGILAPGEGIVAVGPDGRAISNTGTSIATAVASGVAGLLLSYQVTLGRKPNAHLVRSALLLSANGCREQPVPDCRRLLAGRLNLPGAMTLIQQGDHTMSESGTLLESAESSQSNHSDAPRSPLADGVRAANVMADAAPDTTIAPPPKPAPDRLPFDAGWVSPSNCSCGAAGKSAPQLVYALGQLGFDFGSESRRDSIAQHMTEPRNPNDPAALLSYLANNPWDSQAIIWTLNLDATPIYAVRPDGAFADAGYERLRQFLGEQLTEGVERVSIPGIVTAKVTLITGQVLPVIQPALRGMCSWTTKALVNAVVGAPPAHTAAAREQEEFQNKVRGVRNFLERVYHEIRNLGMAAEARALNYTAANAFNIERVFESAMKDDMDLDSIVVERGPICRPGSDCWDVKLMFFFPMREVQSVRKAFRFTVDVSDVVPVTVGPVRSWFER